MMQLFLLQGISLYNRETLFSIIPIFYLEHRYVTNELKMLLMVNVIH